MSVDLPYNIQDQILGNLHQIDKVQLSYTCRAWFNICIENLYSSIYITERKFPIEEAYNYYEDDKRGNLHNWTIVKSDLRQNSPIKLLERTLAENSEAIGSKIRNIVCDDITFILFKLNSWNRRFKLSHQLHSIFFANVPLNHLMTIYDDLDKFYTHSVGLNLTSVQLFNFNDLRKFTQMTRLRNISFYISDLLSLEVKPLTKIEKQSIIKCLRRLESIEIVSTHNLSLNFLENIETELGSELDLGELLFPNVSTISLNHTHGQTNVNDRYNFSSRYDLSKEKKLEFSILKRLFNLQNIKSMKKLKIGCNHIQQLRDSRRDLDDVLDEQLSEISDNENCNCLRTFLVEMDFPNIETFNIVKDGHTILVNPFSLYYFRNQLINLLKRRGRFSKLKSLSIDTQCTIYPFYEFQNDTKFHSIVTKFNLQSKELLDVIRTKKQIEKVDFPDYYQSMYVWEIAVKMIESESIIHCRCANCMAVNQNIVNFLKTNKKIQFYLNPTSLKTFNQYYFDLIEVILRILKNEGSDLRGRNNCNGSTARPDDSISKISPVAQQQIYIENQDEIMALVNNESAPWRNKEISLHSIFQHESYKELVNYNFVRDLSRVLTSDAYNARGSYNPYEITCECTGGELKEMIEYIQHQVNRKEHGIPITTNSLNNTL